MSSQKISELAEETSPAGADIFPISVDLATTPVTKKLTLTNLIAAVVGGSDGHIQFNDGGSTFGGDNDLFWDNINKRLGIGTTGPSYAFQVGPDIFGGIVSDTSGHVAIYDQIDTNIALKVRRTGGNQIAVKEAGGGGYFMLDVTSSFDFHIKFNNTGTADRFFTLTNDGNVGIGTTNPTISDGVGLHLAGKILRIGTAKTPATAGAAGNAGEICWDSSYMYVCIATNTWRRMAHASW